MEAAIHDMEDPIQLRTPPGHLRQIGGLMALGISLGLGCGATPAAQRYGDDVLRSEWEWVDSSLGCILTQEIPHYGRVWFRGEPKGHLSFALRMEQPAPHGGFATLASLPAPWQHEGSPRALGKVRTVPGRNIIEQRQELPLRLYRELEQGRSLQLSHQDPADRHTEIVITVSAIRFQEMQSQFQRCLQTRRAHQADADPWDLRAAGLPDDALDQDIYFAKGSDALTPSASAALSTYARRLARIPEDFRVSLAGFADPRGDSDYNERLSRRRAERVKAQLIKLGVPEKRIVLSFFGAASGQAPQKDPQDLARERRVSLCLVHERDEPAPRPTMALRAAP